jgi:hypothetical protein
MNEKDIKILVAYGEGNRLLGNLEIGIQYKMDFKLDICALDSTIQDKVYWRALVNTAMNLRVLQKAVKFLIR